MEKLKEFLNEPLKGIWLNHYYDDYTYISQFPIAVRYSLLFPIVKNPDRLKKEVFDVKLIYQDKILLTKCFFTFDGPELQHPSLCEIVSTSDDELFLKLINKLELDDFWEESEFHKKLYKEFIQQSRVKVGTNEGQKVMDNNLVLGTKSGPKHHCIEALIHEMAHLIEIDDERALKNGWGFSYGKPQEVLGRIYHEPQTYQATMREVKATVIQSKIYAVIGLNYDIKNLLSPLKFMDDFFLVPGEKEEERLDFLYQTSLELSKSIATEWVINEWKRKQGLI